MRFKEFQNNTNEGRQWTATDETESLLLQINKKDNVRASNVYFQDVQITNAVNVLASLPECKWFFDFMAIKLHELDADGVDAVDFCMHRFESEWHVWAKDKHDFPHVFNCKYNFSFPFIAIQLKAIKNLDCWEVSLVEVSNRVIS